MDRDADIAARLGARIREKRTAFGRSQEAFADMRGLDQTDIRGIERGRRDVSA